MQSSAVKLLNRKNVLDEQLSIPQSTMEEGRHLRTWFRGERGGGAGLMVELDLKSLFLPKQFYGSIILFLMYYNADYCFYSSCKKSVYFIMWTVTLTVTLHQDLNMQQ